MCNCTTLQYLYLVVEAYSYCLECGKKTKIENETAVKLLRTKPSKVCEVCCHFYTTDKSEECMECYLPPK